MNENLPHVDKSDVIKVLVKHKLKDTTKMKNIFPKGQLKEEVTPFPAKKICIMNNRAVNYRNVFKKNIF